MNIFLKFIIKCIVQYKCTAYIQTSDTMANNKMAEIDDLTFYDLQHFISSIFMLGDGFSIQLLFKNRKDAEDFVRLGREYENKRKCVVQ